MDALRSSYTKADAGSYILLQEQSALLTYYQLHLAYLLAGSMLQIIRAVVTPYG